MTRDPLRTFKSIPFWMTPAAQIECPECGVPPQHKCKFSSGKPSPTIHGKRLMAAHAVREVETPWFTITWRKDSGR